MSRGDSIVSVVPCGAHPLYLVKIHANGGRDGCPMCERQPEDVCRSFSAPRTSTPAHAPLLTKDLNGVNTGVWTRIVGCSCGWQTPSHTTDSDDAFTMHVVNAKAGEQP
jgi:hypothetical protein